ncbi:helix-turn-helix domain-containing protein [Salinifilum ghardaiensis]
MLELPALVQRVGPTLLRAAVLPDATPCVGDVVVAEADITITEGDLVLGVACHDRSEALDLVAECAERGAAGLLCKAPWPDEEPVRAAAREAGLALVEVLPGTSWAQLVWLVRAALAEAGGRREEPEVPAAGGSAREFTGLPGLGDLFRVADAVADVVDAPVTIEDAHSQVLAHSARQDRIDPARVSTIMGRRQPDEVLAKFRARGTFRQLSKSGSAVFVPAQQDGTLPRLVVPIRMGGELLGSMWAVVPEEVSEERATAFADTAPLVALRLLRWRAVSDAERQRSAEQVHLLLQGGEGWRAAATELAVSNEPHRVVAIEVPAPEGPDEGHRLGIWEWITRGIGPHPLVTEIGNLLYAVVPDRSGPGGWRTLREALAGWDIDPRPLIGVGTAVGVADLAASRGQADELVGLSRGGLTRSRVVVYEEHWPALVLSRMAGAATDAGVGALGPLAALREHDQRHGSDYVATLHAWLRHPAEPRRASRELRVHPNTFRYRMRRVEEVLQLDLDDPDVRAALLVQLLAGAWAQHD